MIPLGRFLCWVTHHHQDYPLAFHATRVQVCCLRCGRLR